MLENMKETPAKTTSKARYSMCKYDEETTIDTSSFGQRSEKSSPGSQYKPKSQNYQSFETIKQSLFVEANLNAQKIKSSEEEDNIQNNNMQHIGQAEFLTQKEYQSVLNQDLVNLKELQWLIKAFNKKTSILNSCAQKVVNKMQNYLTKSGILLKTKESNKIQFKEFLITDEISHQDKADQTNNNKKRESQQQQINLISNEYILYCKQTIAKCMYASFAPYRQRHIESILLVIDDLRTFKMLPNDDIQNQFIQVIEQIEKNMSGKDQKKYARTVYCKFVNQMLKMSRQEEKFYS